MTQDSLSQGLSSFFLMAVFRFHEKYYQLSLVTPCVLPKDVESNEQVLLVVGYKQSQSGGLLFTIELTRLAIAGMLPMQCCFYTLLNK
jgi:hypothetical protein